MKKILILVFLQVGFTGFSQEKFILSGQILFDSFYQGGAPTLYIPSPTPLANHSLLLIRYQEGDSIPEVVKTFRSDEQGNFSLKVAPGTYGFAAVDDTLSPYQVVPNPEYSQDDMFNTFSSTWRINDDIQPTLIEVKNENVEAIELINFQVTSCGMCP